MATWRCDGCGLVNPTEIARCRRCARDASGAADVPSEAAHASPRSAVNRPLPPLLSAALLAAIFTLIGCGMAWATFERTHPTVRTVSGKVGPCRVYEKRRSLTRVDFYVGIDTEAYTVIVDRPGLSNATKYCNGHDVELVVRDYRMLLGSRHDVAVIRSGVVVEGDEKAYDEAERSSAFGNYAAAVLLIGFGALTVWGGLVMQRRRAAASDARTTV